MGYNALDANTTGQQNVAIGASSLGANTTGQVNTAVGANAAESNTVGYDLVAIGSYAMGSNTTGSFNTAVGRMAFQSNTTGERNTALGREAGKGNTTGNDNTYIGAQAGFTGTNNVTTGSNNTLIGYNAAAASSTASNVITLGNSSIATIRAQVTSITSLSDARDKTDVESIPVGLDFINKLHPVTFTWNMRDGGKVGIKDAGFIAQELMATEDEAELAEYLQLTYRDNPDKLEATQGRLIPILVKAIQELSAKVAELEAKVN
jgi:hypothetical protein